MSNPAQRSGVCAPPQREDIGWVLAGPKYRNPRDPCGNATPSRSLLVLLRFTSPGLVQEVYDGALLLAFAAERLEQPVGMGRGGVYLGFARYARALDESAIAGRVVLVEVGELVQEPRLRFGYLWYLFAHEATPSCSRRAVSAACHRSISRRSACFSAVYSASAWRRPMTLLPAASSGVPNVGPTLRTHAARCSA